MKKDKNYQNIVRLNKYNGESSDLEYFFESETEKSLSEEGGVSDERSSNSKISPQSIHTKIDISHAGKKKREREDEEVSKQKKIDSLKSDAVYWDEFENYIIKYVTNTFLVDGRQYFTIGLHPHGQTMIAEEKTMLNMFPRKLNEFYRQVIGKTMQSTGGGFAPF